MTHAYITLDALKSAGALNITGTANDDRLLRLAEAASSVIDRWCNRHFFSRKATLRFDGNGGATVGVPDLVSVERNGLKTYDGYGGFPTTWESGEYRLLPFNADPASADNPNSRPYTRLLATGAMSGKVRFPPGRGNVEVSGVWGWWRHTRRAAETTNAAIDAAAAAIVLNTHDGIAPGHTLLIGDEQVYVRSRVRNTLSVERGVNGTVSAPIANKSAIDIFEYPPAVSEAALLLAIRMWRGTLGGVDDWQPGDIGMDSDIGLLLGAYRKPALGVF